MASQAGCDPIVTVLGFEAGRMQSELDGLMAIAAINEDWRSGMGSSLRCGVTALMKFDPCPRNILLLVCDQVALTTEFLQELLSFHQSGEAAITAAHYRGRCGVPAIFSSAFFSELLAVSGDQGARRVLEEHAGQVAAVDFPEGEMDLDTPEQLERTP
jgi:molybdenum cofactor cytidylyltransferase